MGVAQDFRLLENDLTVEFKIDIYIVARDWSLSRFF